MSISEIYGLEGSSRKIDNMLLYDIWNEKTGKEWPECFCSLSKRLKFNKFFFDWLFENIDLFNE